MDCNITTNEQVIAILLASFFLYLTARQLMKHPPRALTPVHEQNMIQLYQFVNRIANDAVMPTRLWNDACDIIDDVQARSNARDMRSLENMFGPLAEESLLEFAKGVQRHAQNIGDETLLAQAILIIEKCRHQGIAYGERKEIGL